ncbi:YadA C-terminal domain-containing protein [Citrobacter enshiensis]|uniref:YadA C-terminal domain-containing protein n=1 Tax=Citrobacter enshiensis TaxID=2971264 RepID=UPI0023E8D0F2|nr:YadA C-terminal domain-containing protein [Citrobacter enshiensis]WET42172.1 YadA C-terminal domain-containing protein [Citrobacter enshiensis]
MKFVKSAVSVVVFSAIAISSAHAASVGYIGTIDGTNTFIAVKGVDESVKTYDLDQIQNNTNRITSVDADLNSTKDAVIVVNQKVDDVQTQADLHTGQIASNNHQIGILFNTKADQSTADSETANRVSGDKNLQTQITTNKSDQQQVNHALLNQNIHEDTRIKALEDAPKPKDGKDGRDGVTTTVTKVDSATQSKVAGNSQAIAATAKQSANVAQDLQDAKQFFTQQQASSNAQFNSLKDEVDSNKKEARSGAASAIAIASMPQVQASQAMMVSAGVGSFKNEQALSVGASFHAGSNTIIKAGISDSTNNDFAMGAGVGIGF